MILVGPVTERFMKLKIFALTLVLSISAFAQTPAGTGQAASGDTERELCDGRVDGSEGTKTPAPSGTPAPNGTPAAVKTEG